MKNKDKKNYINKHDLYYECVISQGKGKMTTKLNNYLFKIADGVSEKFRYRNLGHQMNISEDQLSEAYLALAEQWYKPDTEKVNDVFPYYSELAKRACVQVYNHLVLNVRNNGKANSIKYAFKSFSITDTFKY